MITKITASILSMILILSACANDGKELADVIKCEDLSAEEEQQNTDCKSTTTREPPTTSALTQETAINGFALSSPDFAAGGEAPAKSRCDSDINVVPDLSWTAPPENTQEIAIALFNLKDIEEPQLLWLMAGLPADAGDLVSGQHESNEQFETLNDFAKLGYGDPCIESLSETGEEVDLQFQIFALSRKTTFESAAPGNTSIDEARAASTAKASILMRINSAQPAPVEETLLDENGNPISRESTDIAEIEPEITDSSLEDTGSLPLNE